MKAADPRVAPRRAAHRGDSDSRAARRRSARQGQRVRRLPHRPARDEGRGRLPDAGGDGPRDLRHGRGARARRRRPAGRAPGRLGVHHAVRLLPAVRRRTRRSLRQLLRDEPAEGHALRRHDRGCAARTARRSRCTRWPASPSTRSCRRPTSSRWPTACRSKSRRCSAAPSSPPTARSATAPTCAAASASPSSPPAASASTSSRLPRRSARRRSSRSTCATTSSRPRARLGATDVVNATATDATARVRELTDGKGVDVAFEVLGLPQTFTQAFEMIRDGGRMVAVGIAPGKTTAPVEITRLVRRELRIIGSYGARTRSDMPEIIRLAAQGIFRPETMVTQRFLAGRGRRRLPGAGARRDRRPGHRRAVDRVESHARRARRRGDHEATS